MRFAYLLIDLSAVAIPFIFSFHPRLRFDKTWYAFWPACLIVAAFFIAWDMLFVHVGVWGFNERYLTGLEIGNLPIEEILFFICIPYACVFSYHCFKVLLPERLKSYQVRRFSLVLAALLLVGAFVFGMREYTRLTFLLLGITVAIAGWRRAPWLPLFYTTYAVMLIPFFIVNGMLTGTGFEEPIVWYNDVENMGVRMHTIPVEDVFYGMLLIMGNVALYERFLRTGTSTGT